MKYKIITNCIICGSSALENIFNLGGVYLTGIFPSENEEDPIKTPITLTKCTVCDNVQMKEQVNPELMFKEYWYRSGTTQTMVEHLNNTLLNSKQKNGKLFDIGCNDGTLLKIGFDYGFDVYGAEPSNAIEDALLKFPQTLFRDFFTEKFVVEKLSQHEGTFSLVTAISMFYDVPEPKDFLRGISRLLSKEGTAIIEVNYAKAFFERANVDMLGQEHLIYYFIKTFEFLLEGTGLFLYDAYETEMNGGNIAFLLSKNKIEKTKRLEALIAEEAKWIAYFRFDKFEEKVKSQFAVFRKWLLKVSDGKNIKILGASTRGALIVQLMNLDNMVISSAVDLQINKRYRRFAGTNITIEYDPEHIPPDYYLVMPYQFKQEIIHRYDAYMRHGGKLIFYRPTFSIIGHDKDKDEIVEDLINEIE